MYCKECNERLRSFFFFRLRARDFFHLVFGGFFWDSPPPLSHPTDEKKQASVERALGEEIRSALSFRAAATSASLHTCPAYACTNDMPMQGPPQGPTTTYVAQV